MAAGPNNSFKPKPLHCSAWFQALSLTSIPGLLRVLKSQTLLLTICFVLVGCQTTQTRSHADSDEAAIRQVVESFRTSLINKDKAAYMSLFFSDKPEDIGWQFVSEDTRLEHIRKTKPDAIKARQVPSNNFISLIDGAIAAKEPREETFSNVSIDTDGEIASVSFDYAFLANGKKTNWGKEMWQLIRTEQGWKIFSVVYTIRDQWSVGGG
jgi:hypothetical protein